MTNKQIDQSIKDHYRAAGLAENIKTAFDRFGRKIKDYRDTEQLDEFHVRGRAATRELAQLADFKAGMHVLDLGCGVGGPARMLAAEFGCVVTGIDLVAEYCDAAAMITRHAGLSHRVDFRQGDITNLAFDAASFDAAWTLHTLMNIIDKETLFDGIFRILKPGGIFALYEICAGVHSPPYFPVPWAGNASMSFLLSPDDLRRRIIQRGFRERHWQDVSNAAIGWFRSMAASRKDAAVKADGQTPDIEKKGPGISLLLGKTAAEKSRNVFRNLTEDRIRTVFGVFQKPETA